MVIALRGTAPSPKKSEAASTRVTLQVRESIGGVGGRAGG